MKLTSDELWHCGLLAVPLTVIGVMSVMLGDITMIGLLKILWFFLMTAFVSYQAVRAYNRKNSWIMTWRSALGNWPSFEPKLTTFTPHNKIAHCEICDGPTSPLAPSFPSYYVENRDGSIKPWDSAAQYRNSLVNTNGMQQALSQGIISHAQYAALTRSMQNTKNALQLELEDQIRRSAESKTGYGLADPR